REDDARVAARARGRAVAVKPRGLRRLLPGVATLAALAGIWAGAGMLSSSQARPLAVLPGSVKVPGGYSYVVRPGDTLWSIATRLDPGGDPRALVTELSAQVPGGTLQPGSRLRLP
ncbi:MAG: LysM domain-containing protein, partial [Acidimicrobiales bacterium]